MVSQFLGRGKTTAWRAWKAFPEVTQTFIKLSWSREISTEDFEIIELFAVLMYGRNSPHKTVDKCHKHLFTHKIHTMDNCPPAQDALLQHVGWGMSQSDIWVCCMKLDKADQNLADSGWFVDDEGKQQSVWTTLPKASQACKELKYSSCKGLCVRDSYTCKKYNLPSADLCCCQGQCKN